MWQWEANEFLLRYTAELLGTEDRWCCNPPNGNVFYSLVRQVMSRNRKRWAHFTNQMTSKWATRWGLNTCQYIMLSSWSSSLFVVNSWDRMEEVYFSVTSMRSKPSTACFRYYQEQQMAVVLIHILNCREFLYIARNCILYVYNM